jgi:hypothetical protein
MLNRPGGSCWGGGTGSRSLAKSENGYGIRKHLERAHAYGKSGGGTPIQGTVDKMQAIGSCQLSTNLLEELPEKTVGELASNHGIDATLFAPGAIGVGPSEKYIAGLDRWANKCNSETTQGQTGSRASTWKSVRDRTENAAGGWSLFSVQVNRQGNPTEGLAYLGHRIHPSKRKANGLRVDTTGWDEINRGVMLPPLSPQGAAELLEDYGFVVDPATYTPLQAWEFVFSTPEIPLRIEESALKALASCSIGQLAVGINGINGWNQKGRSDRLHPSLNRVAGNGRKIVVRFDCPGSAASQSINQARNLARQLEKKGARGGGWWCWLPERPHKTDDFVAALIQGSISQEARCWLDHHVSTKDESQVYTRIGKDWDGESLDREFASSDIFQAAQSKRVIVLKGATGTAKSKSMLGALTLLEADIGQKLLILGLYHRASLVHKGANEFGVVNMSAPKGSAERQGLHESRTLRNGVFCCGESAYKDTAETTLWKWYWELCENPRPTLLYLDEVSQVLANWTMGGTEALRKVRAKALQALEGLLQLSCVRVWAADALVGDVELEWLEEITGETPWLIRTNFTRPRDLYLGSLSKTDKRTLQLLLNDVVREGGRLWLGHGTVTGLHEMMDALPPAAEGEELRITGEDDSREDPRVSRLMADAEAEGAQYKRIGFSPAISCGISMAGTPVELTGIIQAYHWQAEDVVQALNRARNSGMRILLAPTTLPGAAGATKECSPKRAAKALQEMMQTGSLADYTALISERHPATRNVVAKLEARRNLECFSNEWCLKSLLKEDGYKLHDLSEIETPDALDEDNPQADSPTRAYLNDDLKLYRKAALQRLVRGLSTLQDEQREAKRRAEGGTFLDLYEVDVSETWQIAKELGLDALIRAESIYSAGPEALAVWTALSTLNKDGAKRVARSFGTRSDRIPGLQDTFDIRMLWPLVKAMGFTHIKDGQSRTLGRKWRFREAELE